MVYLNIERRSPFSYDLIGLYFFGRMGFFHGLPFAATKNKTENHVYK